MAKAPIDLSAKLDNTRPLIKVAEGKIYEVDNRKNTILALDQVISDKSLNSAQVLDKIIAVLLGEEAAREVEEMDLTMPNYLTLAIGIMAAATEEKFEVIEARFQKDGGFFG